MSMKVEPVPSFWVTPWAWLPVSESGNVSAMLQSRSTDVGCAMHCRIETLKVPSARVGRKCCQVTRTTWSPKSFRGSRLGAARYGRARRRRERYSDDRGQRAGDEEHRHGASMHAGVSLVHAESTGSTSSQHDAPLRGAMYRERVYDCLAAVHRSATSYPAGSCGLQPCPST